MHWWMRGSIDRRAMAWQRRSKQWNLLSQKPTAYICYTHAMMEKLKNRKLLYLWKVSRHLIIFSKLVNIGAFVEQLHLFADLFAYFNLSVSTSDIGNIDGQGSHPVEKEEIQAFASKTLPLAPIFVFFQKLCAHEVPPSA